MAKGAFSRFFAGAAYVTRGLGFVQKHKSLWPWVLAPALLTLVAAVTGGVFAWRWGASFIASHTAGHNFLIAWLIELILLLFAVGVSFVAYLVVSLVATAPFAGTLSERTEKLATGQLVAPEGFGKIIRSAMRSTGHLLIAMSIWLMITVTLLLIQWVVSPLAPFIWGANLVVTGIFLAYDAWDLSLARRDAAFGEKWSMVKKHFAESLGFGVAVALLLCVPGFGLLIPALAAVGGTLMYVELEKP